MMELVSSIIPEREMPRKNFELLKIRCWMIALEYNPGAFCKMILCPITYYFYEYANLYHAFY